MMDENSIPVLEKNFDFRLLKLTPEEVFILSRINGNSSIKEIIQIVGFPREKVFKFFEDLISHKVITYKSEDPKKKVVTASGPTMIQMLDEEDKDPILSQIPRSFRNRILLTVDGLASKNYFEILEVTPSSESEEIEASYRKLAKEFHPDRMRGKDPGHYKKKLEAVFEHIQEAYQTLRHEQRRATYLHQLMDQRRVSKKEAEPKKKGQYEYKVQLKNVELHFAKAETQFEMGQKEEQKGNYRAAMNFYQMAITLNPKEKSYEESLDRVRKLIHQGR